MIAEAEELALASLVAEVCGRFGHRPAPERPSGVETAIRRLIEREGAESVRRLLERARREPAALDELADELVVTETYFFREPLQFEAIRRIVLPDLVKRRPPPAQLRIWSAGCATGEEAYSLAILLEEEGLATRAQVLASDLSRRALAAAREGVYSDWSFRGDDGRLARRYFQPEAGRWRVKERLRSRIRFVRHNLMAALYPPAPFDVIVCRNVLIYFSDVEAARVAERLHASLAPGGWLVLGPSDPPLWLLAPFEPVLTDAGVFCRRADSRAAAAPARTPANAAPLPRADAPPAAPSPRRGPETPTRQAAVGPGELREAADASEVAPDGIERRVAEAVRGDPTAAHLHYLHAAVLLEAGKLEAAALAARRAIFLEPTFLVAHLMLGAILRAAGRPTEALRALRRAQALAAAAAPDDVMPFSNGETAAQLLEAARSQIAGVVAEQKLA